ncbi:cation-transporting ATPase [Nakaseomyces bracarensis]|uniref:Cation-transporting ATPase n=1 Tax=Nakaseomyces bracarensis TaxID=273131 RepID=A0ABR4NM06_9SACH
MSDIHQNPVGNGRNRPRASFSSSRSNATSATLTSSMIIDQNNSEPYAGAAFEAVPSSIVSFHRPHSFQSSNIMSTSLNSTVLERYSRHRNEIQPLVSTPGRSRSPSINRNFHFFSEEQISQAEGSATLEHTDYDIEWDSAPAYEQEVRSGSYVGSRRSSFRDISRRSSISTSPYGSLQRGRSHSKSKSSRYEPVYQSSTHSSSSLSRYSVRERIPVEVENQDDVILDEQSSQDSVESFHTGSSEEVGNEGSINGHDDSAKKSQNHYEFLKPEYHDRFYPDFHAERHIQRFYISEEDIVIAIAGYSSSKLKILLYNTICILTLGMFFLLSKWIPSYKVKMIGVKVPLAKADWLVIENEHGEFTTEEIRREWYNRPMSTLLPIETKENDENVDELFQRHHHTSDSNPNIPILISFQYRYIKFIFSPMDDIFKTNNNWIDLDWVDIENTSKGLSAGIQEDRILAFDKNQINLKMKTTSQILFDEVLHPFYIFQILSIILWSLDEYYYYAGCIFLISVMSIFDTLFETKRISKTLSEMSYFNCEVRVLREGFWSNISSSELVPGDIYEVSDPALHTLPCDSLLLSGDCIVNEAMLTGESVPVSKFPANEETMLQLFDDFQNTQISTFVSKSFLFNGTTLIRAKVPVGGTAALAMAVRTGFSTTKGSLIRSMVFPKPSGFKFYSDSFKYIGFMAIIAIFGFSISCINFIKLGLDRRTMILRALDIITIVVPPALPATLTIGTSFALNRLKEKGIFCIAPTRVNIGGKIDLMCFDKTGTLTEDGLDVLGVRIANPITKGKSKFGDMITDIHDVFPKFSLKDCSSPLDIRAKNFLISLLTCHSLRVVDGELLGDPLDFKMFQFTGWSYEEDFQDQQFHSLYDERHEGDNFPENIDIIPAIVHPNATDDKNKFVQNDPNNILGIIRSFEFLSELRRMSVIVKPNNDNVYWAYTKGAPEVIVDLCNPSTIPTDYDDILNHYTHNGYRVIACAGKTLPKKTWLYSQRVRREEVESNLEFLGFIVFQNKLKTATSPTLTKLRDANIRTVMCTGDNVLTAISVGKECNLISDERVYVPTVSYSDMTSEPVIHWNDITNPEYILDTFTLQPLDNFTGGYSLAITGDAFRIIFSHENDYSAVYINEILLKGNIFARMSPDEKHELVEQLQKIDYTVGFCGDGANDCGALKAADVGISLSEAEASVAAPFTSKIFDISCVLDVIKEGRASLVTSFACFQYMSLYSAIQFITITILYSRGSNLGDFQFLYIDLLLIVPIAVTMSWSKPYDELSKKRSSANLISPKILVPLVLDIFILFLFQFLPWLWIQERTWYIKPVVGGDDAVQSSDNTVLFFISNFQYILTSIVLSIGPPYREPMWKNGPFVKDIILSILASIILMFISPDCSLGNFLQLTSVPNAFVIFIVAWSYLNYQMLMYLPPIVKQSFKKKVSSKKYKNILRGITEGFVV